MPHRSPPRPNGDRCACGSDQPLEHAELSQLSIAHLDCDAFYVADRRTLISAMSVVPEYLRLPDAELALRRKQQAP